jgi:hypothetical protein
MVNAIWKENEPGSFILSQFHINVLTLTKSAYFLFVAICAFLIRISLTPLKIIENWFIFVFASKYKLYTIIQYEIINYFTFYFTQMNIKEIFCCWYKSNYVLHSGKTSSGLFFITLNKHGTWLFFQSKIAFS